jgi:transposase-like protein
MITKAKHILAREDKARIVLESLNTNISVAELCGEYAVSPAVFYQWGREVHQGRETSSFRSFERSCKG